MSICLYFLLLSLFASRSLRLIIKNTISQKKNRNENLYSSLKWDFSQFLEMKIAAVPFVKWKLKWKWIFKMNFTKSNEIFKKILDSCWDDGRSTSLPPSLISCILCSFSPNLKIKSLFSKLNLIKVS